MNEPQKPQIDPVLFNRFMMANAGSPLSRAALMKRLLDPRRDYDEECGFPQSAMLTAEDYKELYDRHAVGARVVDVWPEECWALEPDVFEDEDVNSDTAFEQAWKNLSYNLQSDAGDSHFKGEEGNPIWEYLQRADKLSRIGHFGVLLFGFNDGRELREPVRGFNEYGSVPTDEVKRAISEGPDPLKGGSGGRSFVSNRHASPDQQDSVFQKYGFVVNHEQARHELLYVRVFDESQIDISRYEMNRNSPRYGHPVEYSICMRDQSIGQSTQTGIGVSMETVRVHWTRVLHITANRDSSELFGIPAQRPVLNNILNLRKVYGSDAEGYWRGGILSHSIQTHPELGADVDIDWTEVQDAYEQFINGMDRIFGVAGTSLQTHAPTVVDPTPHIQIQIDAICIKIGIPKRIFMGSERGELSSGQDADTWDERKSVHRRRHVTPRIIMPFVNRLIMAGVLPVPERGFQVAWNDERTMNESEKADIAGKRVSVIATFLQTGADVIMAPKDLLVRELGYSEEDADSLLENALEHTRGDDEDSAAAPAGLDNLLELLQLVQQKVINKEQLTTILKRYIKMPEEQIRSLIETMPDEEETPPEMSETPPEMSETPPEMSETPPESSPESPRPLSPAARKLWEQFQQPSPNLTDNLFCPTGKGGGVDPTCGADESGGGKSDTSSKAPGSQLKEETKERLRSLGMSGTFPPAGVPLEDIEITEGTAEELKFKALMKWIQKTKSGRISRQYRYTQEFHDRNAEKKFELISKIEPHSEGIGKELLTMIGSEDPKERQAATIAHMIHETGLRPTDGASSIKHGHFGIASLQTRHIKFKENEAHLSFIGKEGVRNKTKVTTPETVQVLRDLTQNRDAKDFVFPDADSGDAIESLRAASTKVGGPPNVKLKDLRTLKATKTAQMVVSKFKGPPPPLTGDAKKDGRLIAKAILAMSGKVAKTINNTPTQARDNYIHPRIFRKWRESLTVKA